MQCNATQFAFENRKMLAKLSCKTIQNLEYIMYEFIGLAFKWTKDTDTYALLAPSVISFWYYIH